jgi:CBS domain containing-hemolysin-like protein
MKQSFPHKMMAKIVKALDPRFEKYREKPMSESEKVREKDLEKYEKQLVDAVKMEHDNFVPQSEKELVQVIRRAPREVLSVRDRNLISGAMSFAKRRAMLITMPREDIVFLEDSDVLGPLNLDKLYKTGDKIFPVLNKAKKVCGIIRPEKIDVLHISKNQPVSKLMSHDVVFARDDYSLEQLLAVFLRNHTDYVFIIDKDENLLGYAELDTLIAVLFNREIKDDFEDDSSSISVSRREI